MRILTAMTRMADVLQAVDAPARQLRGVGDWRLDIAASVTAGRVFGEPAGMSINDKPRLALTGGWSRPRQVRFLYGSGTHRAWLGLCNAIAGALDKQQTHAGLILADALDRAATAEDDSEAAAALAVARVAEEWWLAAGTAAAAGRALIRREDAIMRPVGEAMAAAGGITEVARDKHYHQARL